MSRCMMITQKWSKEINIAYIFKKSYVNLLSIYVYWSIYLSVYLPIYLVIQICLYIYIYINTQTHTLDKMNELTDFLL